MQIDEDVLREVEAALRRIVEPIAVIQEAAAKEGANIDGPIAIMLSKDIAFLREPAPAALASLRKAMEDGKDG